MKRICIRGIIASGRRPDAHRPPPTRVYKQNNLVLISPWLTKPIIEIFLYCDFLIYYCINNVQDCITISLIHKICIRI